MSANLHQYTSSSGRSPPSIHNIDNLHGCTVDTIIEAIASEKPTIVNAPPGSGKTHSVSRLAKVLDFPVTYLTERRKLYRDMEQLCDDMGVSSYVLPSPHEDCPTFDQDNSNCQRGEQEARTLYQNGLQGKTIHDVLNLECDEGWSCPYIDRLDFDPENFDVLIGHYTRIREEVHQREGSIPR